MYKEKERKYIFAVFLFILLILFSYTIVISQDGWTSAGGNSDEKPTDIKNTEAGTKTPAEIADVGNKQDVSGLVGAPKLSENEKSSLEAENAHLKRTVEGDKKKVEITPTEKKFDLNNPNSETKVELNENEFSTKKAKEGEGKLGESKIVIEKKDNEKYAEAGIDTKYTVEGGEDGKENAKDELAGREIELSPESKIEIKPGENGKKLVDIQVPNGGEIHTPGDRKNGEEEKDKETDYRWNGLNLKWTGEDNVEHVVNGELFWNQKNEFYVPSGKETNIDGVDIYSSSTKGNFDTQIFSDGKMHSKAAGSYASFGKDSLVSGSNSQTPGPLLEFQQNNKYGVNIDSESDIFRMQADSNGQISLTNRNPQGLPEGKYPLVEMTGRGGFVNNGNINYVSNGERYDLIRDPNVKDRTSVPIQIIPRNSINGNSLLTGDKSWHVNNFNQKAEIPNNYNFETQGSFATNDGSFDPRLSYNILNKEQQNWVNNELETLEKQQNFLSLNQKERFVFEQQSLENQREVLGSNDPHQVISKLQNQQNVPIQPPIQIQPQQQTQPKLTNPNIIREQPIFGSKSFDNKLKTSSVRMRVDDPSGHSYASGTIIHSKNGESLIATVGHAFRDSKGKGPIQIELLGDKEGEVLKGNLLYYNLDDDIGFVSVKSNSNLEYAKVAERDFPYKKGLEVANAGCGGGGPCLIKYDKITNIDRYQGPSNVEVGGAPQEGRSGGGLFNNKGELIGVVFAADHEGNEGLYTSLESVYRNLDKAGLTNIISQLILIFLQ